MVRRSADAESPKVKSSHHSEDELVFLKVRDRMGSKTIKEVLGSLKEGQTWFSYEFFPPKTAAVSVLPMVKLA